MQLNTLNQLTPEQSLEAKARFAIDNVLYLVAFEYKRKYDNSARRLTVTNPSYDNFRDTALELNSILFFDVKVTEHHRVNWRYEPLGVEPTYHGFIAHSIRSEVDPTVSNDISLNVEHDEWVNQFPYADYGQVSTEADHHFLNVSLARRSDKRIRAAEITYALKDLDDNATMRQEDDSKLSDFYRKRLQEIIDAFHKAYPTKEIVRCQEPDDEITIVYYDIKDRV